MEPATDDGMTPVLRGSLGNFVIIWRKHFAAAIAAMKAAKKEAPNCRQRPWGWRREGRREGDKQIAVQGRQVAVDRHREAS